MDWSIDRDADAPIHEQVENLIRNLIKQDEYQQGKLLPGETEIAERLDISRNTVRMAMKRLVREGLIIRNKGIGSKVNREKVDTNLRAWISFTREMEERGIDIHEYEKEVSWVLPPKNVEKVFDVDPHIQIPKLKRVRGDDTGPIVLFVSYFHPRLNIDEDETFTGKLYEDVLEPEYGVSPHTSNEQIEAKLPEKDTKKTLDMERRLPILYRERIVSDENGEPFEMNECYYRGDRFRYKIEMSREEAEIAVN
jgi:GntR family transcriptional regulator